MIMSEYKYSLQYDELTRLQKQKLTSLRENLQIKEYCVVACSGGVDSMLLATIASEIHGKNCVIFHAISPAVPLEDTGRVTAFAESRKWNLICSQTGEFHDESYLNNPVNRCYYCKSHLYQKIKEIYKNNNNIKTGQYHILSGTNTDDLGEYRPGLIAAKENYVSHPYVEVGIGKEDIRAIAKAMKLTIADLPASPCLSSRIYTGTKLNQEILSAVSYAESEIKENTGLLVVRCRINKDRMYVEVRDEDRVRIDKTIIDKLNISVKHKFSFIKSVSLDSESYRPGRAFIPNCEYGVNKHKSGNQTITNFN